MKNYQIEACETIADYYGKDIQLMVAIEEMSELIKEICKLKRGGNHLENIVDELADVKIMTQQLEHIFNCAPEVGKRVDFKLSRQLQRIELEIEGGD